MKKLLSLFACLAIAIPAVAAVTISSPTNGETVGTTFRLSASASWCSGQWIAAIGYSVDSSSSATTWKNNAINSDISVGTGSHTLHVKSWGYNGAVCVTDVAIHVSGSGASTASTSATSSSGGPYIPSGAVSVGSLQTLSNWRAVKDSATGSGSASGYMNIVSSPSQTGYTRQFVTGFTNNGGERYYATFGDDVNATNFVYDAWIYPGGNAGSVANLEMDLNQVMPNGQTAIFGFQCDGWTSTWDYTENAGTPTAPHDVWVHSGAYCNPRAWGRNAWHHVQISYSRNSSGYVTYHAVWLDGHEEGINATVKSAFALGWAPTLVTNFQVDGYGSSGSSNIFVDNLKVYRW